MLSWKLFQTPDMHGIKCQKIDNMYTLRRFQVYDENELNINRVIFNVADYILLFLIILSAHIPQNDTLVLFWQMVADSVICRRIKPLEMTGYSRLMANGD